MAQTSAKNQTKKTKAMLLEEIANLKNQIAEQNQELQRLKTQNHNARNAGRKTHKLNHKEKSEIVQLYNSQRITKAELARKYNVSPTFISNILQQEKSKRFSTNKFNNIIEPLKWLLGVEVQDGFSNEPTKEKEELNNFLRFIEEYKESDNFSEDYLSYIKEILDKTLNTTDFPNNGEITQQKIQPLLNFIFDK